MSIGQDKKFIHWKRNLFFIAFSQFLAMAGTSVVIPFIPIYLETQLHIDNISDRAMGTSLFYSVGMLSFCISNPLWGALGDRFGRKLMLLRAYFVTALTFPAMYFMPNLWSLIAMRFVASMFSGTVSAAQALVASSTPDNHQGFALGTLSAVFWSGNMFGLMAGGMVVHYCGYFTVFMLCGVFFLLGGLVTLFGAHEEFTSVAVAPDKKEKTFRKYLPDFGICCWVLLGCIFIIPLARRCDEPYLAFAVELIGGKEKAEINTSRVTAAAALGGIFSGSIFGRLSDKYKPLTLLVPALIVAGLSAIMQSIANSLWWLAIFRFTAFFAMGGLEPIFLAMLSKTVDPKLKGSAFGWCASFRVFGGMFGAMLGGWVVILSGARGVLVFTGLLLIALIGILAPAVKLVEKKSRR